MVATALCTTANSGKSQVFLPSPGFPESWNKYIVWNPNKSNSKFTVTLMFLERVLGTQASCRVGETVWETKNGKSNM